MAANYRSAARLGALLVVGLLASACAVSSENQTEAPVGTVASKVGTNEVIVWSDAAVRSGASGVTARNHAIVHVAMFEAANAITNRYHAYFLDDLTAPCTASVDAAVATAAHDTLVVLVPTQTTLWNTLYTTQLAAIPDGQSKTDGVTVGQAAAAGILALRSGDPSPPPPYTVPPSPGIWRNTPPFLPIAGTDLAVMEPWAMDSKDQFRPGPPPEITSKKYTKDWEEIKAIGPATGSTRTPEQTAVATFWRPGSNVIYEPFAQQLAIAKGFDVTDTARLLALVTLAIIDANISAFDGKYFYNQWRPITGIREADTDNNPKTTADPLWTPLLTTPPWPDYPSGHAVVGASVVEVLREFIEPGDNITIALTSPTFSAPPGTGATRTYATVDAIEDEIIDARVWAGIHWRTSDVVAEKQGRKVGNLVVKRFLKHKHHHRDGRGHKGHDNLSAEGDFSDD